VNKSLSQARAARSQSTLSACEALVVGPSRTRSYQVYYDEFEDWTTRLNGGLPGDSEQAQDLLLEYLDILLEGDATLDDARSSIAAVKHHLPFLTGASSLPRVSRALKGYAKRYPPRARAPCGKEPMAAIAHLMMFWGCWDAAVQVLTIYVTYVRPGALRQLCWRDLLAPVRQTGPLSTYQLHIAATTATGAAQPVTKTGTIDEGVPFDKGWEWLGALIAARARSPVDSTLLFSTPAHRMVYLWKKAASVLGLGDTVLYMLRHGGASEDLLSSTRTEAEIMTRGHWRTMTSVRRYAKQAQLQKLIGSMTTEGRAYGSMSYRLLREILEGRRTPTAPSGTPTSPEAVRIVVN
jgi:integrase